MLRSILWTVLLSVFRKSLVAKVGQNRVQGVIQTSVGASLSGPWRGSGQADSGSLRGQGWTPGYARGQALGPGARQGPPPGSRGQRSGPDPGPRHRIAPGSPGGSLARITNPCGTANRIATMRTKEDPMTNPTFPAPRIWTPEECEPFDTAYRPAVVKKVVDADTMDLAIDLGLDRAGEVARIRLTGESWLTSSRKIGFNAWEKRGADRERGLAATDRASELMPLGTVVLFRSWRGGSRGSMYRWLGLILVKARPGGDGELTRALFTEPEGSWYSLADLLLHEGHGREWWRGWNRGSPRPQIGD